MPAITSYQTDIMIQDITLRTDPRTAATPELLEQEVKKLLRPADGPLHDWRIRRQSIDARQRRVMINMCVEAASGSDRRLPARFEPRRYEPLPPDAPRAVIVGAGPAGLFAALRCIELGVKPQLLERGADVDARRVVLARISREGIVDPDCNYCFGEGGAGAYSDGKLYTRSKKRGNVNDVLQTLVTHGADERILIDAHPHIGSDRLPGVIAAMRETILSAGGEVHFHTRVTRILLSDTGAANGVECSDGRQYAGPVILATGHSARDVYRMLHASGVHIEAKGLAIGVRLEHPQDLVDRIQYHSPQGRGKYLPAAEYSFVEQADGRGVYSFCMCPGGVIVPAASAPGQLVVNGMSSSSRGSRWANSGMVVEVHPGDFPEFAEHGPLEMLALQEKLEHDFFLAAGSSLKAPAQRMSDFVNGKVSSSLPSSSYAPGLQSLPLHFLLPPFISKRLQEGFRRMGRKSRGFLSPEATLIGLESRTSSPVRIPRDNITMEHIALAGLYPAGEGAGYAGGIVSAAMDGARAADALCAVLLKNKSTI